MNQPNHSVWMEASPLAMAYVPWQRLTQTFDNLDEAFLKGTIFPELYKPFDGRRYINGRYVR